MYQLESNEALSYLDTEDEDLEVTKLLKKYEISTKTSYLYNLSDDYQALIDYISDLVFEKKEIPEDILFQLNHNFEFKSYLLLAIKNKLKNIFSDNRTIMFKEIITIVNLLSFGKDYEIFESYNFYNLGQLEKLFREYEDKLQKAKQNDEKNFITLFSQYILLIEALNELCTINSSDVLRKKTINPLIEVISETINITKYNIKLDDIQVNTLNNILGKVLFYYSHIPYINVRDKDSQYLIEEFKFIFEKLCDGYELSKNTNFGGDLDDKKYYKTFLNSLTTLISTLLYKLKQNYELEEFNNITKFNALLELYDKVITHVEIPKFKTLHEFKMHLLNNYLYIYDETLESNDECIIDKFLEKPDFNDKNMHILYLLVLFSCRVDEKRLLKVLDILISMKKFNNDYHEFCKLNICDVIINRFCENKQFVMSSELTDVITSYIEENKVASHLISIYSKIYLSLSLYNSYSDEEDKVEQSKLFYFFFNNINGTKLLENEYSNINKDILENHGRFYLRALELDEFPVDDKKAIKIGERVLSKFFKREEINQKFKINQALSNIITDIFNFEGLSNDLLNTYIEKFISRDIFYGLTFCTIEGLCEAKCVLIDSGYEKVEIPLIDGYKLKMAYSIVYKDIFEHIFKNNKEYITQNLINLIISYIKSTPIYLDTITKLPNIEKLKLALKEKEENEFIFVELHINNLINLNAKYDYAQTNDLFKEYGKEINLIIDTYRLTGPKLGFILNSDIDYKSIIEKISKIKMHHKKEDIDVELTFAVSFGNSDNILMKASHCMSLALKSSDKYYEFK